MERANYWTEGEEPGCRRGSKNRTKEKDSCGEVRIAAGRGTERSGQTVLLSMANRIIAFLLLAPLLNHCSPGLKKATCRPSATAALPPHAPDRKAEGKESIFVHASVCHGRSHHRARRQLHRRLKEKEADLPYCVGVWAEWSCVGKQKIPKWRGQHNPDAGAGKPGRKRL